MAQVQVAPLDILPLGGPGQVAACRGWCGFILRRLTDPCMEGMVARIGSVSCSKLNILSPPPWQKQSLTRKMFQNCHSMIICL